MKQLLNTRRGRFYFRAVPAFVLFLATAITLVGLAFGHGASAEASNTGTSNSVREITVGYGDTLWSISGQVSNGESRSEVMTRISELNDLETSKLSVGQTLFVPNY